MSQNPQPIVEIVGTFPSSEALESAISALTSSGWDRSELSLLAQHGVIAADPVPADTRVAADDAKDDHQALISEPDVRQGRTLAAGMAGVMAAFAASGATILTGGTALAAVVGAAVAGGGVAAVVEGVASVAGENRNHFLNQQIEHGGVPLWVKLHNPSEEAKAREIMSRHGGANIHVHPMGHEAARESSRRATTEHGNGDCDENDHKDPGKRNCAAVVGGERGCGGIDRFGPAQ